MTELAPENEARLEHVDDDRQLRAQWDLRQRHLPEFASTE
jgi:hypothetical protein